MSSGFRPRLVALDVDGTLVGHDNSLSPRIREAVHRVVDAGVHVVISTGRSWPGTFDVLERLGLPPSLAVMSNGAVVASTDPFEVVRQVTFDAREVVETALRLHPEAIVAVEDVGRGYRVTRAFPDGEMTGAISVEPVERLVAEPVTRVVIRDPNAEAADFERLAAALGYHGVEYFVGWTAWLDIAPHNVTKADGLRVVCEQLGVDAAEVLAVGDGNNDIEMLRWAGRGVAMGQAIEQVRIAADHVTGPVERDGLAVELDRWFPGR